MSEKPHPCGYHVDEPDGSSMQSEEETAVRHVRGCLIGWVPMLTILVLACGCATSPVGDYPWDSQSVESRMMDLKVPGLSLAVIDDYEIAWTASYGRLEVGSDEPVTDETLFQTASIGKSVTALAALHQVALGSIDLDQDATSYLTSWALPENDYTRSQPVTLRRLLSHTAGTTVSGFLGYERGAVLPTLRQILDGAPPANSPPVLVDVEPGSIWRYSGGGYLVVQQVLEDVTGEDFAHLVTTTVFDPLLMTESLFDPLPESRWTQTASGHRPDGTRLPSHWHTYPEMGAGPFWSTPTDMARFGIEVMLAYSGRSDRIITESLGREMFTPVANDYGLGFALGDDGGDRLYALHRGANEGYRSEIVLYPKRGEGVVIMTNSDGGDPLADELVASLSSELGWYSGVTLRGGEIALLAAALVILSASWVVFWARRRHL
jgi:CubicO group peptidase (beta-lactamase class C family)